MAAEAVKKRPVYFIAGHGSETKNKFIVPKGCYIVVKTNSCIAEDSNIVNSTFEKLLTFDMTQLRNPKAHEHALLAEIGSVAIYGPGEICPDFQYQLVNVHFDDPPDPLAVWIDRNSGSGIIDIEKAKIARAEKTHIQMVPAVEKLDETDITKHRKMYWIAELYLRSVYPTSEMIYSYLTNHKTWNKRDNVTLYAMLNELSRNNIVNITQSELCSVNPSHQRRIPPGVYYHNICRSISTNVQEQELYNHQLNELRRSGTTKASNKTNVSVSVQNVLTHPFIGPRIFNEALHKRAPILPHYYQSSAFRERQRQVNELNRDYLTGLISEIDKNIKTVKERKNVTNHQRKEQIKKLEKTRKIQVKILEEKTGSVQIPSATRRSHRRSRSRSPTRKNKNSNRNRNRKRK